MRAVVLRAAGVAALALAAGAAAVPAPLVIADEEGDNEDAPDVVEVRVASEPGVFAFRISFAAAPPLTSGEQLVSVLVDADRDETTGPEGFEYALRADASGARLETWIDAVWEPASVRGLRSSFASSVLSLVLPRAAVGGTRAIDFLVVASEGDTDLEGTADIAPELGNATFALPDARRVEATLRPVAPRAGRPVGLGPVGVVLSDGSRAPASVVVCSATVRGRPLPGAGRCSWRLPRNGAGAMLVVHVRAAWEGSQAPARTLRVRVR
jgi:hypothetical protein